ncbi:hypothetical protein N0V95_006520 [Ascochyta clinopodiicola]|nr:hypothetical protein N0V95_006520 [Ascochyta clinopodiicola]
MVHLKSTVLAGMAAAPSAYAWGSLGHVTVAYIAQNLVSAKTKTFAQGLLDDTSTSYLANVATWADSYRYTAAGTFSAPLHYLDALDSPPKQCNVNYERDCPEEGCIVSAIANYSTRAVNQDISLVEQQKALKWIVHFIGDIHQPLHVENLEVGGNLVNVTFNGAVTNLHAAWDTAIPQKQAGVYSLANAQKWATTLTTEIKTGSYAKESKTWSTGLSAKSPVDSAMVWASDANSFVCTTVIPKGADAVRNQELSGAYYTSAIPVVQKQIAKAGFRLAAWLDAIVANAGSDVDQGVDGKFGLSKRDFAYEAWQLDAKAKRAEFGDDCGCGEEHAH